MYAKTATEYLQKWDAGDSVWTLEMGGIGPGYEQAIQVLVAELLRDQKDIPLPEKEDEKGWQEWGNKTVSRIDKSCGGFSGAQVGAAKWLAVRYITEGPEAFFEKAKREHDAHDRMIQCSNFCPKAST